MIKRLYAPLRWHGGKFELAPKFIDLMPAHLHYVEPYFGGGHVLFAKEPAGSEVVNDIHGGLINFWSVLRDPNQFGQLRQALEMIPVAEDSFRWAMAEDGSDDPVTRAAKLFVRFRQSRQGLGVDFVTLSRNRLRRGINEQVSQWLGAVDGLPEIHGRLQQVVILNHDALDVIRQQDGPNTLFYLDPPYMAETRSAGRYDHEVDDDHHRQLLALIQRVDGKVMLSGYHSPLYDSALAGWRLAEFSRAKNSSSRATKERATECLWMNFPKV